MRTKRVLVSVAATALALVAPVGLVAQSVVLPIFVILDSEDNPVGPVVGFDAPDDVPIIRFVDPQVSVPVMLRVFGKSWIRAYVRDTYFDDDGCQGNAFHFAFDTFALNDLSGFFHSVAKTPAGGDQMLFRSDATVAGVPSTPYKSRWDSGFDFCSDTDASENLRPATFVLNLDSEAPPPYKLGPV